MSRQLFGRARSAAAGLLCSSARRSWVALALLGGLAAQPLGAAEIRIAGTTADPAAADLPMVSDVTAAPVTPTKAAQILQARERELGQQPLLRAGPTGQSSGTQTMATQSLAMSATVPGPNALDELKDALRCQPSLLYEFVRNQINYVPAFGLRRGALGTVLDQEGNDFDQASLLVTLLRDCGYTADYAFGRIRITMEEAKAWLGVDGDPGTLSALLSDAGIPIHYISQPRNDFSHVWVRATIGGQTYFLDPSYKPYVTTPPAIANLATAMGYDRAIFLDDAIPDSSSPADPDKLNVDRNDIRVRLHAYGENLTNAIRAALPNGARFEDAFGGRRIDPASGLPAPSASPPHWDGSTLTYWQQIPNAYRTLLILRLPGSGIPNQAFYGDQIYGERLTLFYMGADRKPELRLGGQLLATGLAAAAGARQYLYFDVYEPYPAKACPTCADNTYGDSFTATTVGVTGFYRIVYSSGNPSRNRIELHRHLMNEARAAGDGEWAESVVGESFGVMAATYLAESARARAIMNGLHDTTTLVHHWLGVVGIDGAFYIDQPDYVASHLDLKAGQALSTRTGYALTGVDSAIEWGMIEHTQPVGGMSTVKLLDTVRWNGGTIRQAASMNQWWSIAGTLDPDDQIVGGQLVNYTTEEYLLVQKYVEKHYRVVFPLNGDVQQGSWIGLGFWALPTADSLGDQPLAIIWPRYKGGAATSPQTPPAVNAGVTTPSFRDPARHRDGMLDLDTGAARWSETDISQGSAGFPFGLSFERSYDSTERWRGGPLGRAWTHNFDIKAETVSEPFLGMGERSATEAAGVVAALYVAQDALQHAPGELRADVVMTATIVQRWFMDMLLGNVISVGTAQSKQQFVYSSNGLYTAPPGSADTLTYLNPGFRLTTKHGEVSEFNADRQITSWKDRNDNTVSFTYDASKRLTKVSNGMGRELNFTYDTSNRITQVADSTGRAVTYGYGMFSHLVSFTDAEGKQTTYGYPRHGLLGSVKRPASATPVLANTFDSLGRVSTQTTPNGTWTYYIAGFRTEEIDPLNFNRLYFYDEHRQLTQEVIPAVGNDFITTYEYDGHGRLVLATPPELNATRYEYDARHNVTAVRRYQKGTFAGAVINTLYTYEAVFNQLKSARDELSNWTTFTYDVDGNLTKVTHPAVGTEIAEEVFSYNTRGQVLTATDAEGRKTTNAYDAANGNLLSVTVDSAAGGLALQTQFLYDAVGNVTKVTDPKLNFTTFGWNKRRQQLSATRPLATQSTYEYDANGRVIEINNKTGNPTVPWQTTTVAYDPAGNITRITDPGGDAVDYAYDGMGRVETITRPMDAGLNPRVVRYDYNRRGLLIGVTYDLPGSTPDIIERFNYTDNGKISAVTDGNGNVTSYSYNPFDRPYRATYPNGSFEQTTWDAAGNLVSFVNRGGQSISYTYDARNRRITKQVPGLPLIAYAYDKSSLLEKVTEGTGVTAKIHLVAYDSAGRKIQATLPDGKLINYAYDKNGNLTRLTWPDPLPTRFFVTYDYDALNRVTDIKDTTGAKLAHYSYDFLSRLTATDFGPTGASSSDFTYEIDDDLSRIVHTFNGSSVTFDYAYNKAGERKSVTASDNRFLYLPSPASDIDYTVNNLNQYTAAGGALGYDSKGNLTSGDLNVIGTGTSTFAYTPENRLASVTEAGATTSYGYDPFGRRVSITTANGTSELLYAGSQIIADYGGGVLNRRYIPGPGMDDHVLQWNPSNDHRLYYHRDALGSVVAAADADGVVQQIHAYGPFGEPKSLSGAPFRYTGQWLDAGTQLYDYKARLYSPKLGRFLQPDPIGYSDGLNLYAYVGNDPANGVDPLGLSGGLADGGRTGSGKGTRGQSLGGSTSTGASTGQSGGDPFSEKEQYYARVPSRITETDEEIVIETTYAFGGKLYSEPAKQKFIEAVEGTWTGKWGKPATQKVREAPTPIPGKTNYVNFTDDLHVSGGVAYTSGGQIHINPGAGDFAWAAAHEHGHVLGMEDKRDTSKKSATYGQPWKTWEGNIMASHGGKIDERNIREALQFNPH